VCKPFREFGVEAVARPGCSRVPNKSVIQLGESEENEMKKLILIGAVLLPATVVLASKTIQPLNVSTGLWEVTLTSKISTLPTPNTNTYKTCVAKQDLTKYPFTDPEEKCTSTVLSSTGSKMEARGTCRPEGGGPKYDFSLRLEALDAEHVEGKGRLAISGPSGTMNGDYSAKAQRIGDTCSADVN
jgi:hypothetical protein